MCDHKWEGPFPMSEPIDEYSWVFSRQYMVCWSCREVCLL